jgi:starvation-inducible DNA-binding protein
MKAKIDIGITEKHREEISKGLSHFLADSYTLYLKTHNFHWNVTGPMFPTLHVMFEGQYQELALAVDEIAERIRALGMKAPATYQEFIKLTSIKENTGELSAMQMVAELVQGHEAVIRTARGLFSMVNESHDEPTADILIQRLKVHEKTAWMLRSMMES